MGVGFNGAAITKAITKGYSIGSAALACFLLFSAFMELVQNSSGRAFRHVDFAVPEVFVGGLLGARPLGASGQRADH